MAPSRQPSANELPFTGFPADGLAFLTELGSQDKAWFQANRATYDESVVGPTKAFVTALGEELQEVISPDVVFEPKANGSIAPINNDLRFSPDKSPYKDHLLLRFWEGSEKKLAPTLFVRIAEGEVGFATGAAIPDVDAWRELIRAEATGGPFAAAIAALGAGRDLDVAGAALKRVPAPYDAEHPRAELLKHKSFQARWTDTPTRRTITSAGLVPWCVERLTACASVHRWLVDHL